MTNAAKAKGDRAEREVAALLCELGLPCRRKLGAGRLDDVGDIDLVVNGETIVVQVADYTDALRAIRDKLPTVATQVAHANATLGVLAVRRRGGSYLFVMDEAMFATWTKEATT